MRNDERAALLKSVYLRLANPEFQQRVRATNSDGVRPIMVALRTDPMSDVLDAVNNNGGVGNIVIPVLNGFVVVSMVASSPAAEMPPSGGDTVEALTADCTVGVFLERLSMDANEANYRFIRPNQAQPDEGRAGVVALAG